MKWLKVGEHGSKVDESGRKWLKVDEKGWLQGGVGGPNVPKILLIDFVALLWIGQDDDIYHCELEDNDEMWEGNMII